MKRLDHKTIILGPVRLSYLNVFKPRHSDTRGEDEYTATLLIPKKGNEFLPNPAEEVKALNAVIKEIALARFGADFKGVWVNPIKDGDKELRKSDGEPKHPGYWFISTRANATRPPKLIDGARRDLRAAGDDGSWVSGDWGLVKLDLFAYDTSGNKGVSSGIQAIQFLYKDEPFGGSSAPSDEGFDVVESAAGGEADEYDAFADQ